VKLTNSGTTPLRLSSVTVSGNFALSAGTTCGNGTSLMPSSSCQILITFTPVTKGTRTGSLVITDNALLKQQVIILLGSGI